MHLSKSQSNENVEESEVEMLAMDDQVYSVQAMK